MHGGSGTGPHPVKARLLGLATATLVSCTLTSADAEWGSRVRLDTAVYSDTDHVFVLTPSVAGAVENPTRGIRIGGSYLVDAVTAASVDIVSTASKRWSDVRHAGTLDFKVKPHDLGFSGNVYVSSEHDHRSLGVGGSLILDFGEAHAHTATFGYAFAQDTDGRADTPFSVFSRVVNKHTLSPGVSFTVDSSTMLSFLADLIIERGDSSKPYRYVPFFASSSDAGVGASIDRVNAVRLPERALEHLPDSRNRFAVSARFLHRWEKTTLRLLERLYVDSWGLVATTTDVRLPVDLDQRWRVYPHLRLNIQNSVSFWQRAYTLGPDGSFPRYYTGDRENGALRTYVLGAGGQVDLGGFTLSTQVDGMVTQFLDTLYIKTRTAVLATVGIEKVFE